MAFDVNYAQVVKAGVVLQGNYGTLVPPTGGTDDIICYTNDKPFQHQFQRINTNPLTGSFTKRKGFSGPRVGAINIEVNLMGSGTAGSAAVNGFKGIDGLIVSSGHTAVDVASTSITYKPSTITQIRTPSTSSPRTGPTSIYIENDTHLHKGHDCLFNMSISANTETGAVARFEGLGLYNRVTDNTSYSNYVGGDIRAQEFLNMSGTLTRWTKGTAAGGGTLSSATAANPAVFTTSATHGLAVNDIISIWGLTGSWAAANGCWVVTAVPTTTTFTIGALNSTGFGALAGSGQWGGGVPYTYVGQSFNFTRGAQIGRVKDFNSVTGLKQLIFGNARPSGQLVIALDNDSGAGVKYAQIEADAENNADFSLRWLLPDTTGNNIELAIGQCVITNLNLSTVDFVSLLTIDFEINNQSNEADYSLRIT